MAASEILAVGAAELMVVLILLCVLVIPIAAVAFARSGRAYDEIGKGRFAVDFDQSDQESEREEIRQLVEAKAYRQSRRGETPLDVENEIERLLKGHLPETDPEPDVEASGEASDRATGEPGEETAGQALGEPADPEAFAIRAEIRQVVIAKNESRERRGEEPLDVEAEVDRMLEEFG